MEWRLKSCQFIKKFCSNYCYCIVHTHFVSYIYNSNKKICFHLISFSVLTQNVGWFKVSMGYEQTVNMFQGLADLTQDKFGAPKSWAFVESFYYIIQRTSSKFTGNKTKRKKETIIGIFFDK